MRKSFLEHEYIDLHTKFLDADDSLNPNPCQWAGEELIVSDFEDNCRI